eukprot:2262307-Rhodomonas_salina.4
MCQCRTLHADDVRVSTQRILHAFLFSVWCCVQLDVQHVAVVSPGRGTAALVSDITQLARQTRGVATLPERNRPGTQCPRLCPMQP